MRWRSDEHVLGLDQHVEVYAKSILHKVKQQFGPKDPERAIREVLTAALAEAYEAGTRYGKAAREADLVSVVQSYVERALKGIHIEAPHCPHCSGIGCGECGGTGKFRS